MRPGVGDLRIPLVERREAFGSTSGGLIEWNTEMRKCAKVALLLTISE
jgi:hypothetical protein